jgi:hypothetical protein
VSRQDIHRAHAHARARSCWRASSGSSQLRVQSLCLWAQRPLAASRRRSVKRSRAVRRVVSSVLAMLAVAMIPTCLLAQRSHATAPAVVSRSLPVRVVRRQQDRYRVSSFPVNPSEEAARRRSARLTRFVAERCGGWRRDQRGGTWSLCGESLSRLSRKGRRELCARCHSVRGDRRRDWPGRGHCHRRRTELQSDGASLHRILTRQRTTEVRA